VNDESFKLLLEKQWKKVNYQKESKKAETEQYISANYTGLTGMPGGLRYKILVPGKGNVPSKGSVMDISYKGRLASGLSFVSSSDAGKPVPRLKPADFSHVMGEDGLISGLNEALKDMKQGEKRLLIIPPELGYGINSAFYGKEIQGEKRFVISPGETLIIEVTLNKLRL
jgi:peptidylprolyl isomerase